MNAREQARRNALRINFWQIISAQLPETPNTEWSFGLYGCDNWIATRRDDAAKTVYLKSGQDNISEESKLFSSAPDGEEWAVEELYFEDSGAVELPDDYVMDFHDHRFHNNGNGISLYRHIPRFQADGGSYWQIIGAFPANGNGGVYDFVRHFDVMPEVPTYRG